MTNDNAIILYNTQVSATCFRMGIACDSLFEKAVPGQFVMVGVAQKMVPLLRRPFSIHRLKVQNGTVTAIEILYKVVGKSTQLLASLKEGDAITMMGPLGRGFRVKAAYRRSILVGGGIGIAPLCFLGDSLKAVQSDLSSHLALIGGRSAEDVLCRGEMADLGLGVSIATDDGSAGRKGLVTVLLSEAISEHRPDMIYACGPHPMLKAVAAIAETHGIACQLSIETMMACGMGACLACAVPARKTPDTYLHACINGPVFDSKDIVL